jgi:hypothetical protein
MSKAGELLRGTGELAANTSAGSKGYWTDVLH